MHINGIGGILMPFIKKRAPMRRRPTFKGGLSARASKKRVLLIFLLMFFTIGALAGLAGISEAAGPVGQLTLNLSPGYGFAAIIVAFAGRLSPVGCIPAAFILALFYLGGELGQSRLGLPSSITGVYQGLLLFFLLLCDVWIFYKPVWCGFTRKGSLK